MAEEQPEQEPQKELEYLEQLQRLQAEFINYKNRIEKEKTDLIETAKESILRKFLDVKDNFERAPKHDDGIELIYKQLCTIFDEEDVKEMVMQEMFDPRMHMAVGTKDDVEKGRIASVLQKGYMRKNNMLRPAYVVVGSKEETK